MQVSADEVGTGLDSAAACGITPGYTHVVPLGLSCRVTHQLRRFFAIGVAYPFDWWIATLPGITQYLANPDPERVYGHLEEMQVEGRVAAIRSSEFGFQLFHEFPRTRVAMDGREVSVVVPVWRDHVQAARNKHVARLQRLLALDQRGNRILFVRHKYDADGVGSASAFEVEWLKTALEAHRIGTTDSPATITSTSASRRWACGNRNCSLE